MLATAWNPGNIAATLCVPLVSNIFMNKTVSCGLCRVVVCVHILFTTYYD